MQTVTAAAADERTFEFWYDFASPYSYLAAMRLDRVVPSPPYRVLWTPFMLGPLLKRRGPGAPDVQAASPAEAAYRRRDVERSCADEGIPLTWPSTYPRGSLLATRVALVAGDDGWCDRFTRAVFRANFVEDQDIGATEVVASVVRQLKRDVDDVLSRATAPVNKARLVQRTEEASRRGVFGAPTLVHAPTGELFWGNDRLERAVQWTSRRGGEKSC